MEETYTTKVIILNRYNFRENDSRVIVYSRERGKLELVARGTKKISSKLAGHLEPISLSKIMVVKGRQFDYVGGALSENCFLNIKSDLEKIESAGKAVGIFGKIVKPEEKEEELFDLLKDFLEILNQKDFSENSFLLSSFLLKLLSCLGYAPELFVCVICKKKIMPQRNKFDFAKGGLVCGACKAGKDSLTISDNSIKILRFIVNNDLDKIIKIKSIPEQLGEEIKKITELFLDFHA